MTGFVVQGHILYIQNTKIVWKINIIVLGRERSQFKK